MKYIVTKQKIWLISLIILMGFHAHAYLVDGLICFSQPQGQGPVREEQIVSFKALVGVVSPLNTKQKNETMTQYLHRMNEPLRTIDPELFKGIQDDINNISDFKKSSDVPILVDDYKVRNFSTSNPCYIVPLSQLYKDESKKWVILLSPFTNVKKLSTPLSAIQWFSIANANYLSVQNYLGTRISGFEGSPTFKRVFNMLYSKAYDITFETIKDHCIKEEFKNNIFCQESWIGKRATNSNTLKVVTNSDTLVGIYNSIIMKKCIQDQGGVLKDMKIFNECINREKENRRFGNSVSNYYDELGDKIHQGNEKTINGLWELIILAPLHPVAWAKKDHDAQSEINHLQKNLESVPAEDFFQIRGALVEVKNEMMNKLRTESTQFINIISQSNLTNAQKEISIYELNQVVSSGLFFESTLKWNAL